MIGIFPVTYVEIIPGADPSVTPLGTLKSMKSGNGSAVGTLNTYIQEGQGKAKFNFQVIPISFIFSDVTQHILSL